MEEKIPSLEEITRQPLRWANGSSYADVRCYEPVSVGSGALVVKRMNKGGVSSSDRASSELINASVEHFRDGLIACGVPVIAPYVCLIDGEDVVHICGFGGDTVQKFLSLCEVSERRHAIASVINAIAGVLGQRGAPEFGIDARMSNFCRDSTGRVTYVDVFPALCKFNGQYFVHWPNPSDPKVVAKEVVRKFQPMGIIRRLRFDTLEAGSCNEKDVRIAIVDALGNKEGGEVLDFLDSLPDRRFAEAGVERKHQIIDALSLDDTDAAREIAISIVPNDSDRKETLKKIFINTSSFAGHHGVDPREGFEEVRRMLHSFVR